MFFGFLSNKTPPVDKDYKRLSQNLSTQIANFEKISKLLITGSSLDESLDSIIKSIPTVFGALMAAILVWNEEEQNFTVVKLSIPNLVRQIVERALNSTSEKFVYPGNNPDNIFVKTLQTGEIHSLTNISDSLTPLMNSTYASAITSLTSGRIKQLLGIPMQINNQTIGTIALGWNKQEFDENDKLVMKIFANYAAIAIYNSRLFGRINSQVSTLELQNRDLQSLYNLSSKTSESLELRKVAQAATDAIPQDENMLGVSISLIDEAQNNLTTIALSKNPIADQVIQIMGDLDKYQTKLDDPNAQANQLVAAVKDGGIKSGSNLSDLLIPVVPAALVDPITKVLGIKSYVVVPLMARDKAIGTITYYLKGTNYDELSDNQKQLLSTYAAQLSVALENAKLYSQTQEYSNQLKQQNADLAKAFAELKDLRQQERDMLDVMGHELRTPISIVRNALLTLEMDYKKDNAIEDQAKLGKYLDIAIESVRREIKLIETMLSTTKLEGDRMQLQFTKVDMLDVINDAIEAQKGLAKDKQVEIVFTKPEGEFIAYGDRVRTQEVLDNFVSNAVKYTPKGNVVITLGTEGDFIRIDVKDSGIGIAPEDLQNLGKKFFRAKKLMLDNPGATQPSGTGLGLFVTFQLIEMMHGKRYVTSKINEGSSFGFALPKYTDQPLETAPEGIDIEKANLTN